MYIYTPLCRYWIALYRYVLVFIVAHVDIELEDNKQFISNIPRIYLKLGLVVHYEKGNSWILLYAFFMLFLALVAAIFSSAVFEENDEVLS